MGASGNHCCGDSRTAGGRWPTAIGTPWLVLALMHSAFVLESGGAEQAEQALIKIGRIEHSPVREASGPVASRQDPGVFWTICDSTGRPVGRLSSKSATCRPFTPSRERTSRPTDAAWRCAVTSTWWFFCCVMRASQRWQVSRSGGASFARPVSKAVLGMPTACCWSVKTEACIGWSGRRANGFLT